MMRIENSMKKITLLWELRIEGGENEVIAREEHLVLIIENSDRVKVGCSENERIGKVKINACVRIENKHERFDHI